MDKAIIPGFALMFRLGTELADKVRKRTSGGKDVDGSSFKDYTRKYANRKAGGKFKRQTSYSTTPDLKLTGDLHAALQVVEATDFHVDVGWSDSESSTKIYGNALNGRMITKDSDKKSVSKLKEFPFSSDIEKWFNKQLGIKLDKQVKLTSDKIIVDMKI